MKNNKEQKLSLQAENCTDRNSFIPMKARFTVAASLSLPVIPQKHLVLLASSHLRFRYLTILYMQSQWMC